MLTGVAWILVMLLLVVAGPVIGMALGVALASAALAVEEWWHDVRGALARETGRPACTLERNLPGLLLRERQRQFRVEATDEEGHRRVYLVAARHAGAAHIKARAWRTHLRDVRELPAADL